MCCTIGSPRRLVSSAVISALLLLTMTGRALVGTDARYDQGSKAAAEMSAAATEEITSVTVLRVPVAHPVRTVSRLTVPPGAQWERHVSEGSLLLAVESGTLGIRVLEGAARIAWGFDPILGPGRRQEVAPGVETILGAGDRLVAHGDATLVVRGVRETVAIATVVRVSRAGERP
jgi:hypothetical protein